MFKRTILAALLIPMAGTALAGFHIEGTPALTTETGLLSNRTHYEQEAKASFRMPDAKLVPAQKKYEDASAKMVVDKAYRVVTHKGTGKAVKALGYADSIPLESALSMVIPAGWQVYQSADLKKQALPLAVSYEGGKDWPEVLASLGEYNALKFHIDWYDKVVMMSQGRPVYTSSSSRIRIIDEPTDGVRNRILGGGAKKPKPVVAGATATSAAAKGVDAAGAKTDAVALAAKPDKPIEVGAVTSDKTGKAVKAKTTVVNAADLKDCPKCLPSEAGEKKVVAGGGEKAKATTPLADAKKAEPVKPVGFSLFVREGFLQENIARLSKENGWNAPDWQIQSDFKVNSSFSVSGKSFPEAMAKLLMIHPIEADVNTNQRRIYVTKEAQ